MTIVCVCLYEKTTYHSCVLFVRFCESPSNDDLDSRTPKGRGKRGRNGGAAVQSSSVVSGGGSGGGNGGSNGGGINNSGTGNSNMSGNGHNAPELSNVTETRSGKVRGNVPAKGRRGTAASNTAASTAAAAAAANTNNSPFATPNSPQSTASNKRKGRDTDSLQNQDSKNNKRSRVCGVRQPNGTETSPERSNSSVDDSSTAVSPPALSPQLIECPEPNCSKKYKHINGLKYHQNHAHNNSTASNNSNSSDATESGTNPENDDGLSNNNESRGEDLRNSSTASVTLSTASISTVTSASPAVVQASTNDSAETHNNNNTDLVKSTVLRYSGQTSLSNSTSANGNVTSNVTSVSSSIAPSIVNGTVPSIQSHQIMPQQVVQSPQSAQTIPQPTALPLQQQVPQPPLQSQQIPHQPQPQQMSQQAAPHGPSAAHPQAPPSQLGTPVSQPSVFHPSIQQQQTPPFTTIPGTQSSIYPVNSVYGSPSQPVTAHSPLSTLSPQQLQSLQCPAPTAEIPHNPQSVIAKIPAPAHQMYVYPPNSGASSPHRPPVPQTSQTISNTAIRPAPVPGVVRAPIQQQTRLPNPQIASTPPTNVLPSSPRLTGPPLTPQSTPLSSLPGSATKTGPKSGRESADDDPRSPAYSDISDAADAPGGEGDGANGVQPERREDNPKPDQLLLQAPPPYVGLSMYPGFDGSFSVQSPYVLRYPPHPLLKPEQKDGKSGDEKKDGPDTAKFPPGQSPFPAGVYPYGTSLPPPHYTNDPYYAHLAHPVPPPPIQQETNHGPNKDAPPSSSDASSQVDKSLPVPQPNAYRPPHSVDPRLVGKEGPPAGTEAAAQQDKQFSLQNAYRQPPSLDPRLILAATGIPILSQVDKSHTNDASAAGKDGKANSDGNKPENTDSSKTGNRDPPVTAPGGVFYQAPPGFSPFGFDYRAMAAHFPPQPYLPQQLRYPPAPEDLTRSPNSTSTPPPPPASSQYAPHNLTPHKIIDIHERSPSTCISSIHQPSPGKPSTPQSQISKDSNSKPATPTPSVGGPIPHLESKPSALPAHFNHYHQLLNTYPHPPPAHHYAGLLT